MSATTQCMLKQAGAATLCISNIASFSKWCDCRLAKERSAEDHLFGDKEKFVTSAYRKKLEEDKKWLAEEKVREAQEQRNDVVKKGHMGDFYRSVCLLLLCIAPSTSSSCACCPSAFASYACYKLSRFAFVPCFAFYMVIVAGYIHCKPRAVTS